MSAHKLERLAASIERAVREVLSRGLADDRIRGLITVTGVKVLGDLTEATINVSVLPEDKEELTLHGLNSAASHVRHEVGELIETRQLPKFRFRLDRSLKMQASVLAALEAAKDDLEKRKAAGLAIDPPMDAAEEAEATEAADTPAAPQPPDADQEPRE